MDMNNRKDLQEAASKRRRKMKTRKFMKAVSGNKHSKSVASYIGNLIGGGHAYGGGRSNFGANPIFQPRRGKFKGYMRTV